MFSFVKTAGRFSKSSLSTSVVRSVHFPASPPFFVVDVVVVVVVVVVLYKDKQKCQRT